MPTFDLNGNGDGVASGGILHSQDVGSLVVRGALWDLEEHGVV